MALNKATVLRQLDDVLNRFRETERKYGKWTREPPEYFLYIPTVEAVELSTLLRHTIERFRPVGAAAFGDHALDLVPAVQVSPTTNLLSLGGMLSALRAEYEADRLETFRELVHADLFADFLEMADHLLEQGYYPAAAVTAGAVLEEHLRKLCGRHGVATTITDKTGKERPKMTDGMNTDLAKEGAYNNIERQLVAGWAAVRNAAAHGEADKFNADQVRQMVEGVRGFFSRHPA